MKLLSAFLIALLICGIALGSAERFGIAQNSGTNVGGIINSDTTWTQAGSPYYFTNTVTVAQGVTLIIEPGVEVQFSQNLSTTVNKPDYYTWGLNVNGTLHAVGTPSSPINFELTSDNSPAERAYIEFYNFSSDSVIENVNFEAAAFQISIFGGSPKFSGDTSLYVSVYDGSPLIENNVDVSLIFIEGGSTTVYNNSNVMEIVVQSGSPSISDNFFTGGMDWGIELSNYQNQLENAVVNDNIFNNSYTGGGILISGGSPLIERNFVDVGTVGITIYGDTNPIIENNTIVENSIGLNIYSYSTGSPTPIYDVSPGSPSPTIEYNNFEQNSPYNIYLGQQNAYGTTAPNITATNDWWGTTDALTINSTIYDFKDDFTLGTVAFAPFLIAPNTEAAPNPNAPIPTPNSSPSPTSSSASTPTTPLSSTSTSKPNQIASTSRPSQKSIYEMLIAILAVLVSAFVVVIAVFRRGKGRRIAK